MTNRESYDRQEQGTRLKTHTVTDLCCVFHVTEKLNVLLKTTLAEVVSLFAFHLN